MSPALVIVEEKPTQKGLIPIHWDICLKGNPDSLVSVWIDKPMAEFITQALTHRKAIEESLQKPPP